MIKNEIILEAFSHDIIKDIDIGYKEEVMQVLKELGYLLPQKDQYSKEQLYSAINLLREELTDSKQLFADYKCNVKNVFLNNNELNLLHELISMNGTCKLYHVPQIGEKGLVVRVLHYRLTLLGLFNGSLDKAFSEESMSSLIKIVGWLELKNVKGALEITNNIDDLINMFSKKIHAVYFRFNNRFKGFDFDELRKKPEFAFFQRLKDAIGRKPAKEINRKILKLKELKEIDSQSNTDLNKTLLRILQIKKRTIGFYSRAIDNIIGEYTFQSILDFVKINFEKLPKGFMLQNYLVHIKDGWWIFNIVPFFKILESKDEPKDYSEEDLLSELNTYIAEPSNKQKLTEIWKANIQETKKSTVPSRLFANIKDIIRSIGGKIKQFFKWVMNKLEKITDFIKNVVHALYREIREGIRLFYEGIKFLFGHRFIVPENPNSFSVSKFDFDFDGISFFNNSLSAIEIKQHCELISYKTSGLYSLLTFMGRVINFIIKTATGGWQLAIELAKQLVRVKKINRS